jgi:hypothetical protein
MSLKDPKLAKLTLMDNMERFRDEMHSCAQKTREIECTFEKLIKCGRELNEAMANDLSRCLREA